jgi:formate-dependent phosphoribosylglycinamide formyltransferase (GAR transformylase)
VNVLLISPGYPPEMPFFTRGLAQVGARVIGVGDQHESAIPPMAREHLAAYLHVRGFSDEGAVIDEVLKRIGQVRIDRVECLWEPLMILAAKLRERLGLPGMTVAETIPFRDKEEMKRVLDAAGIRTPWHARATTAAQVREAVERIGYPAIVKPIAGAGSSDTHRIDDARGLEAALAAVRHVPEVSVEEFVDAEEYTFDTVCAGGRILYYNICWYRPRPLVSKQLEWVSPQTVALRNPDTPELAGGRAMGEAVLRAMNFRDGFTHMEWYRKADGEVVFGEIAARPAGGRTVDVMNFSCDIDLFRGWAEATCHGRISHPIERRYNAASIFKRAQGQGRIRRIDGLGRLLAEYGAFIPVVDLLPLGAPRRDWQQTLISDGMVIVRHPDLATTIEIADRVATDLQLVAG